MYGYIPIANANKLKESYTIATPATWQFTKGEELYGGVEEIVFTEAQKNELEELGGGWFEGKEGFLEWVETISTPQTS